MATFAVNNVATNYLAGRRNAQDEKNADIRNVLAEQSVQRNQQVMSQDAETFEADKKKQFAERLFLAAEYGLQSPAPKQFIEQNFPEIAQAAGDKWRLSGDEEVKRELQGVLARRGSEAGIRAAPAPVRWESKPGPRGSIIQINPQTGEQKQVVGPDNTQAPAPRGTRFRALTPQEIAGYGLPPGSSAQINDETGQVQVLNKPSVAPAQSAAERKAAVEAKTKMPRIAAAKRRALRLSTAVNALKDDFLNGGPADAKALQYTKKGRELMAAAAQLMPELSALTRVPGIGSQSDLEARLASLAMPSLEFDPVTNERSMAELDAFINDLDAAYQIIASGGQQSTDIPEEAGPAVTEPPSLDDIRKKYGR